MNKIPEKSKEICLDCIDILRDFPTKTCTSFELKKTILIDAIEKGEWVLIDDVHFAPHEIERLMSLLEENPTLTIYENTIHEFYSRENINEKFRLFIITSDDSIISSAIKSRCLCVRLQSFNKPQHYAELISGCLNNYNIDESLIIDMAKYIGNAFYELKKEEKQSNFILKNYLLSSVNLVNVTKVLLSSKNINGKSLAEAINFAIFSMFKDKKISFIDYLKKKPIFNVEPIITIQKRYEDYLGLFEWKIISYEFVKRTKGKEKNNNFVAEQIRMINELLNQDPSRRTIIQEIKREEKDKIIEFINSKRIYIYENIELFTLTEIEEYQDDIKEVLEKILEKLVDKNDQLYKDVYYLKYLDWIFSELLK